MTDKLKQAAETAIWNLEAIATSDWRRWEDSATPEKFEAWVKNTANYSADALRQALAEPDMGIDRGAWSDVPNVTKWVDELRGDEPQRDWVGLTDEEAGTLTVFDGLHDVETPLLADFVRAIEAKLKEKNCG